jgi:MtfA peptidase
MRWRRRHREPDLDPAELEAIIDANVALGAGLDPSLRARLFDLTHTLVELARWEAVGGLSLTNEVRVTIAANAAIPILGLDTSLYRQVRAVIVRPSVATVTGARAGPSAGTMTDDPMSTSGVAMDGSGPLAISWDVALADSRQPSFGRNVVIHEFAHKIDMSDGYADGTPPLRGPALARWTRVMTDEYERPDGEVADAVLDPYAWTNPVELFAVATEAFFCIPSRLVAAKPGLYDALRDFYNQDPATDGRQS